MAKDDKNILGHPT